MRVGLVAAVGVVLIGAILTSAVAKGQEELTTRPVKPAKSTAKESPPAEIAAPNKVDVQPLARDEQIARRLAQILIATEWFERPTVRVNDGVVFLGGVTATHEYKDWSSRLAQNTQDVVAVVNKMEVTRPAALNLTPAFDGLKGAWRDFLQNLPYLFVGIVIMVSTVLAMPFSRRASERLLAQRIRIPLVRDLIARAVAVIVFLVGLYLVLRVSGTTQLALTVLGGTGLFGLVLGIAFRDITENFLASVFLSMQRPFQIGDLVEIVGVMGFVDRLTVRTTIIVSLDGNYVQIPNATVYKNTIRNFTNNPKRRDEFTLFIAYDKSLDEVQSTVLKVLNEHPTVLKQPEPWVLVDRLSERSVEVRVYFWIDCVRKNWLTVRSSIIRLALHALKEAGLLTLPGASQMVFPQGIAIHRLNGEHDGHIQPRRTNGSHDETAARRTKAEGRSTGPAAQIEAQRQEARPLEAGPDLLAPAESPEASRQAT